MIQKRFIRVFIEKIFVEIAKVKPDVVVIDLRLYEKIDGIDLLRDNGKIT